MFAHAKAALSNVAFRLKTSYPDNIVSIYAFGSRVRGDHLESSDFDVLVLVKDRTITMEEQIIDVFVEEELKSGICLFSKASIPKPTAVR